MPVEMQNIVGKELSAVREAVRDIKTGSTHLASPSRFGT